MNRIGSDKYSWKYNKGRSSTGRGHKSAWIDPTRTTPVIPLENLTSDSEIVVSTDSTVDNDGSRSKCQFRDFMLPSGIASEGQNRLKTNIKFWGEHCPERSSGRQLSRADLLFGISGDSVQDTASSQRTYTRIVKVVKDPWLTSVRRGTSGLGKKQAASNALI